MTICSASAIVPVREFAGIDRARLMLAGKAAETALLINSWRNVRRSVVMIKASIGHLFRWRDESVTFSRIFENLESACATDQLAEMAPVLVGGERALSRCIWSGPEGCVENGPAAVRQWPGGCRIRYVSIQIYALLPPVRLGPPCKRPILNATTSPLYVRRYTS